MAVEVTLRENERNPAICVFCHQPMIDRDAYQSCPGCQARAHIKCWDELARPSADHTSLSCPTLGCPGAIERARPEPPRPYVLCAECGVEVAPSQAEAGYCVPHERLRAQARDLAQRPAPLRLDLRILAYLAFAIPFSLYVWAIFRYGIGKGWVFEDLSLQFLIAFFPPLFFGKALHDKLSS